MMRSSKLGEQQSPRKSGKEEKKRRRLTPQWLVSSMLRRGRNGGNQASFSIQWDLPDSMLYHIISFVDFATACRLEATCQDFHRVLATQNSNLFKWNIDRLWPRLYAQRWHPELLLNPPPDPERDDDIGISRYNMVVSSKLLAPSTSGPGHITAYRQPITSSSRELVSFLFGDDAKQAFSYRHELEKALIRCLELQQVRMDTPITVALHESSKLLKPKPVDARVIDYLAAWMSTTPPTGRGSAFRSALTPWRANGDETNRRDPIVKSSMWRIFNCFDVYLELAAITYAKYHAPTTHSEYIPNYLELVILCVHRLFEEPTIDRDISSDSIRRVSLQLDEIAARIESLTSHLSLPECCDPNFLEESKKVQAQVLEAVNQVLFTEMNFRGAPPDDFFDLQASLLPVTLVTRTGIPLTLALLYHFVCNRVGLAVKIVGLPGHIVIAVPFLDTYVDVCGEGRLLSAEDCVAMVQEDFGLVQMRLDPFFKPISLQRIVARMLTHWVNCHGPRRQKIAISILERIWDKDPMVSPEQMALFADLLCFAFEDDFLEGQEQDLW